MTALSPSLRLAVRTGAIGLVAGVLALAAAPAAVAADLSQNAALRYWRVWSIWQTPEITEIARQLPDDLGAPGLELPDNIRAAVEAAGDTYPDSNSLFQHLVRATALPDCDFGLDTDLGIRMLIPHLAKFRASARLLAADARLRLDAGDHAGAAERIAAGYRLAQHTACDNVVISSLVAASNFQYIDNVAKYAHEHGALDADSKAVIREALFTINPADPLAFRACIASEREMMASTLRETFSHPDPQMRITELVALFGDDQPLTKDFLDAVHDEKTRQSYLDLFDGFFIHLLRAWDAPDGAERILKIESAVKQGVYGPFATHFAASFSRVHKQSVLTSERLEAALDRVAH